MHKEAGYMSFASIFNISRNKTKKSKVKISNHKRLEIQEHKKNYSASLDKNPTRKHCQ